MRTTRVFLADDHMLVRQGMRSLLEMEEDIVVVGEASNGQDAIEKVVNGPRPHVILMDVHMPMMTGIEATRRIKMTMPDVLVIGLTASEDDSIVADMLRSGASGYVLKSAAASDLVKTIRSVRTSRTITDNDLRQRLTNFNAYNDQLPTDAKKFIHQKLTRREMDVMQALLRGYSNKEIARELVISERTVQTHLSNIFSKMDVNSRTEAVLVAMRDGWTTQQPGM
ncbi:MAG: response regulator transcription factor [Caldilineaceae bacterium]|nr:response regulator transcription factor [Caldilineaceae bacterium]